MYWICAECGCQGIAGDLTFCPQCFKDRPQGEAPSPETAEAEGTPGGDSTLGASSRKVTAKGGRSSGATDNG